MRGLLSASGRARRDSSALTSGPATTHTAGVMGTISSWQKVAIAVGAFGERAITSPILAIFFILAVVVVVILQEGGGGCRKFELTKAPVSKVLSI